MRAELTALFHLLQKHITAGLSCRPVGINTKGQTTKYFDAFIERRIISFLKKHVRFRADIISEEQKKPVRLNAKSKGPLHTIIIDPVDGSENYKNKIPFVCMAIAVFDENGQPFMSFCGNYYSNEYFYADTKTFYSSFRISDRPGDSVLFTFSRAKIHSAKALVSMIGSYELIRSLGATVGELMLVMKGAYGSFADIRGTLTLENFAPFFLAQKHKKIIITQPDGSPVEIKGYSLAKGYRIAASGRAAGHKKLLSKLRGI